MRSLNFIGGSRSLKGDEIPRDLAPGGKSLGGEGANPCDTGRTWELCFHGFRGFAWNFNFCLRK